MKKKIYEVTAIINGIPCKTVFYTDFVKAYAHVKRLAVYGFNVHFNIETRYYNNKKVLSTSKVYFFENRHIEKYTVMSQLQFAGEKMQTVRNFAKRGWLA